MLICTRTQTHTHKHTHMRTHADDEGDKLDGMDATTSPHSSHPQQHPQTQECELKFECQMYKVREDEYMIDIQVRRQEPGLVRVCDCERMCVCM
jgi:hypothetical protein